MAVKGREGFSVSTVRARARDAYNPKRVHLPSQSAPKAPPDSQSALAALTDAQQKLSRLLIAEDRDPQAIAEAADVVRRLEHQAGAERRG